MRSATLRGMPPVVEESPTPPPASTMGDLASRRRVQVRTAYKALGLLREIGQWREVGSAGRKAVQRVCEALEILLAELGHSDMRDSARELMDAQVPPEAWQPAKTDKLGPNVEAKAPSFHQNQKRAG